MVMMTKQQALDLQLKQLSHYAEVYKSAEIVVRVLSKNRPEMLDDDKEYPSWEVHRYIPCGAAIERELIAMGLKAE